MTRLQEKSFIHKLYQKYYANKKKQVRDICIKCGKPRVLGKRGNAKLKCKKCRKEN